MRRAGEYVAAGGRSSSSDDGDTGNAMCPVFGCPLPGAISRSTVGGGPWFCRFHFGRETNELGAITDEIRRMKRDGELDGPRPETKTVAEMRERLRK